MNARELRDEADVCDRRIDRMFQEIEILSRHATDMRRLADATMARLGRVTVNAVEHPFERALQR